MGRYSRYPAVNREVPSEDPKELIDSEEESEEPTYTEPVEVAPEVDDVVASEPDTEVSNESDNQDRVDWPSPTALGEMSTREVLKWVGDDPDRAAYAAGVEEAGRERKTLLRKLRGA